MPGQAPVDYGPLSDMVRNKVNLAKMTVQESRHRLARAIVHGKRGQIYQPYCQGQEDRLGALGLVPNAVVLWNLRNSDAAVIMLRRYAFTTPTPDGLRPLRNGDENGPV